MNRIGSSVLEFNQFCKYFRVVNCTTSFGEFLKSNRIISVPDFQ